MLNNFGKNFGNKPYAVRFAMRMPKEEIDCEIHGKVLVGHKAVLQDDGSWLFPPKDCELCAQDAEEEAKQEEKRLEVAETNRAKLEKMLNGSLIPLRFQDKTIESYNPQHPEAEKAKRISLRYVENFPEHLKNGTGLNFWGNVGTGKTHLAAGIALELIKRGYNPLYRSIYGAIGHIKRSWNRDGSVSETEALNSMIVPDLLILDEIGVQFSSDTERLIAFEIINARYESKKPTIIISNLSMEKAADVLGERVIDRLRETNKAYRFLWDSHRKNPTQ